MNKMTIFGAVTLLLVASPAMAAPDGNWRCSAQGNIPIGLMTIKGTGYKFQAVSNSLWKPKPSDSLNGSGNLAVDGSKLTMASGPLHAKGGVRTGVYGASGKSDYMDFFTEPKGYYYLRCLRP